MILDRIYFYFTYFTLLLAYTYLFSPPPEFRHVTYTRNIFVNNDDLSSSIWCVGSTDLNARFENNSSVCNCQQVYKSKI